MVQGTVRFLAAVPTALVHALYFFVPSSRPLLLMCTWNGDERVDGGQGVASLHVVSDAFSMFGGASCLTPGGRAPPETICGGVDIDGGTWP